VLFQEISRFATAYPLEDQLLPVHFEGLVDGSGADGEELCLTVIGNLEGGSGREKSHLFPDERARSFPHRYLKKAQIIHNDASTSGP
jgi:hypothetical protein